MGRLTIFHDYVLRGSNPTRHPPVPSLPLEKFAGLPLRWPKYRKYLLRTENMEMDTSRDYDGYPFEDFYTIRFDASVRRSFSGDETSIIYTFNGTHSDDFDYVAMASRSTTTAYKRGTPTKSEETRFKLYRVGLIYAKGDPEDFFPGQVDRLVAKLDQLDLATEELKTWAEQGINMSVRCSTASCRIRSAVILPSERLLAYAKQGRSLEDLRVKLKCSMCGERRPDLKPA